MYIATEKNNIKMLMMMIRAKNDGIIEFDINRRHGWVCCLRFHIYKQENAMDRIDCKIAKISKIIQNIFFLKLCELYTTFSKFFKILIYILF